MNTVRKNYYDVDTFLLYFYVSPEGAVIEKSTGKHIRIYHNKNGYCYIRINRAVLGGKFNYFVHRLVAMIYCDKPEHLKSYSFYDLQVNHKDGDKDNNNYSNLEWCTAYENNKHARDTGLNNVHENNLKRWSNLENVEKQSQTLKKVRLLNPFNNDANPNHKFTFIINGNKLFVHDICKYLNITTSKCYRNVHLYFKGVNNIFTANNILIESQSTIEKQSLKD